MLTLTIVHRTDCNTKHIFRQRLKDHSVNICGYIKKKMKIKDTLLLYYFHKEPFQKRIDAVLLYRSSSIAPQINNNRYAWEENCALDQDTPLALFPSSQDRNLGYVSDWTRVSFFLHVASLISAEQYSFHLFVPGGMILAYKESL